MSRTRIAILAAALAFGMSFAATAAGGAPKSHREQTLYTFRGGSDGSNPGPLIADAHGNLYGTTTFGGGNGVGLCGNSGCGTVFRLTPRRAGYSESVLYAFQGGSDGARPNGGLIFDAGGSIYGTLSSYGPAGYGSAFKLTLTSGGTYTETILHAFAGGADGDSPSSGLVMDSSGALYGTTWYEGSGCASNQLCGTAYKLTPTPSGYTKTELHTFLGGSDGAAPEGNLLLDKSGALYGTTYFGGGGCGDGCGTVFKLTPNGSTYQESLLYRFPRDGGKQKGTPIGIVADTGGNL